MMTVGIALENNQVSEHFGHSNGIAIFHVLDGQAELINKLRFEEHVHGAVPQIALELKINVIICGHLGFKAKNMLEQNNVEVISGIHGDFQAVIEKYVANELESDEEVCAEHDHGDHEHGHCH